VPESPDRLVIRLAAGQDAHDLLARTERPKAELMLSDAERAALEGWVRRRPTPQAWALRCRIILACAAGA
jgi:hypothetical protein